METPRLPVDLRSLQKQRNDWCHLHFIAAPTKTTETHGRIVTSPATVFDTVERISTTEIFFDEGNRRLRHDKNVGHQFVRVEVKV